MKSFFWILSIILLSLYSCRPSHDGVYVVYDVNENSVFHDINPSTNDTIAAYLKRKVLGTKFKVSFNNRYVTLKNNRNEELVLTKNIEYDSTECYKQDITTGDNNQYSFRLKVQPDGTLIYGIKLSVPPNQSFIPAQLGGPIGTSGIAICFLSKVMTDTSFDLHLLKVKESY